MPVFPIGIIADSFRLPPTEAVQKAADLGADGIQIYTVRGEMAPESMDRQRRGAFRRKCESLGLEISALCGDMGGGFRDPERNPEKVEKSKRIVDLAVDLGTSVVTTHFGVIPDDPDDEAYQRLHEVAGELAAYAFERGVSFAIETGPEKASTLKAFIEDVDSPGLGANLDPANLVMVVGDDPVEAARILGPHIVHTHAKDGRQNRPVDPMAVYHGGSAPEWAGGFEETPLGEGAVDWDAYLAALEKAGYGGFLTIEREVGDQPEEDIATAVAFLREKMQS
jgi:sugar phosphate isomerase/epimerase